jgi:flagellar biosynthesis protein FlhG
VDHFLGGVSLDYLGFIPNDPAVNQSVMQQKPLVQAFPNSPAARAIKGLAKTLLAQPVDIAGGNIKFFWRRLVDMA